MSKKIFPYNPEIEEQIKKIKLALRIHMNGEVSSTMADKGLTYKLNYGTLLPELKKVSRQFTPNELLAERLWYLNIRETMILATYLYPTDKFMLETAQEWVNMVPTQEIAEIAVFNLFSKLPYAETLISEWITQDGFAQLCAWILLVRNQHLLSENKVDEFVAIAVVTVRNTNTAIQHNIISFLKKAAQTEPQKILSAIDVWKNDDLLLPLYNNVQEEINFYLDLN